MCQHESRWCDTHMSRHDQYPSFAGLPELPVCSGQWSPGISPAAGLCLKKKEAFQKSTISVLSTDVVKRVLHVSRGYV